MRMTTFATKIPDVKSIHLLPLLSKTSQSKALSHNIGNSWFIDNGSKLVIVFDNQFYFLLNFDS